MVGKPKTGYRVTAADFSRAYRPVIIGYLHVAAIYYAVRTMQLGLDLSGPGNHILVPFTALTSLVALICARKVRKINSVKPLEMIVTAFNLLVFAKVMVEIELEFSTSKLAYFAMLMLVYGLAWVSVRQSVLMICITFAGLVWTLQTHAPQLMVTYLVICVAAASSAVGTTYLIQHGIGTATAARREAVAARNKAERRLAAAERLSEAMLLQSMTDSLTGLPNRRAFFDKLAQCRTESRAGSIWLLLLDLDGFKAVNDNYGHVIGDELLRAVTERLRAHCGSAVHASRMGGDEFNFVFEAPASEIEVELWCEKLLERISEVYLIDDRLVQISGSIGCFNAPLAEPDEWLIQHADYALLHAKRNGKNRVVVFREDHAKDAARRFQIEQALRIADFDREIDLVFQPQFDLNRGRITCAEALARWNSPALGVVAPDDFIAIAEDSGLISRVTLAVIDKSIAAFGHWATPVPVSINLSSHDLMSNILIEQIIDRIQASSLPPEMIEFEVTETAMMSDTKRASDNLLRLAELGHPIALDDFGTGYSNFNYLRTLPIRKLKIDRSFLENLADPATEKILHSLTGMARTLNVDCLIEGIENELELVLAKRVGASIVQGYLFGRPMSEADLASYLAGDGRADRPEAAVRSRR